MSVLEYRRYRCLECRHLFDSKDALKEQLAFSVVYGCPDCGCQNLAEVTVCTECLNEECVEGEDLGRNCLNAEKDAVADMSVDQWRTEGRKHISSAGLRRTG